MENCFNEMTAGDSGAVREHYRALLELPGESPLKKKARERIDRAG